MSEAVNIEKSWLELLGDEFSKEYFTTLKEFVRQEYEAKTIYPSGNLIFNAYNLTPVDEVKVVIIGQDPYHGEGQAHGLCFSVPDNVKIPPSLMNIFKELKSDVGLEMPLSGNLERWSRQGVLLLNSTLTVISGKANAHKDAGWSIFTDQTIRLLSNKSKNIVFLLWGNYAHQKECLINKENGHLVLKTVHPSPLSAYNGFFGCRHFSKTNEYLSENGRKIIKW